MSIAITVITPAFNRAHTLPAVYESLLAQTFRAFEWVLVDDGSSDGTREWVESLKAPACPIVYRYQPNSGKPTAVNLGLSLARGDYVVVLDSDDKATPDALSTLV